MEKWKRWWEPCGRGRRRYRRWRWRSWESAWEVWWFLMCDKETLDRIQTLSRADAGLSSEATERAHVLLSKLYFRMGASDYEASLTLALRAPQRFLGEEYRLFVDEVVVRGLQHYQQVKRGQSQWDDREETALTNLSNIIVNKAMDGGQWNLVLGYAMDTGDVDLLRRIVTKLGPHLTPQLLLLARKRLDTFPPFPTFRIPLYTAIAELFREQKDWIQTMETLALVEEPSTVSMELLTLLNSPNSFYAFQAAFDMVEKSSGPFIRDVLRFWPLSSSTSPDSPIPLCYSVLQGSHHRRLHQHFFVSGNKVQYAAFLPLFKAWLSIHHAVAQTATVIALGFIHFASGNTDFIMENIEWCRKISGWNEFTAAATVGVLYKHSLEQAQESLDIVLHNHGKPFSVGGGLFGLGIVAANTGHQESVDYLSAQLAAKESPIKAGACLGIGLTALGSQRQDLLQRIINAAFPSTHPPDKQTEDGETDSGDHSELHQDWASLGVAGAIAAGLLMLGSGNRVHDRLLQMSMESGSVKVKRALSLALALLHWGTGEEANTPINSLCSEPEPQLRRAGVLAQGVAYAGTGASKAIAHLSTLASTDVNQEVRQAAGTALGLVCTNLEADEALRFFGPLLAHHCPYTRYGAVMGLSICSAGSGQERILQILLPCATKDTSFYVREGALLGASLIAMGHSDDDCPTATSLRRTLTRILHQADLARLGGKGFPDEPLILFGSILSQGVAYAGCCKAGISLTSSGGLPHQQSLLGLLLFAEHWHWFPLSQLLCLAFRPLSVFVLDQELRLPRLKLRLRGEPELPALILHTDESVEDVGVTVSPIGRQTPPTNLANESLVLNGERVTGTMLTRLAPAPDFPILKPSLRSGGVFLSPTTADSYLPILHTITHHHSEAEPETDPHSTPHSTPNPQPFVLYFSQ